uniref:DUF4388 domain-containing protein n=1 Tax=Thermosporothrix sp. COM3 TaxID=2490863 RepID=A0A455SPF8_9CHLR|nr:hypothetical protein KTC_35730 [Thermosporothrix sp. COM3]
MYNLDIETLISVLQNRRITGFLEADLSTGGLSGSLRKGTILVELQMGKIVTIRIRNPKGQLLFDGQQALQKIRGIVFAWQLTEATTPDKNRASSFMGNPNPALERYPAQYSPARSLLPASPSQPDSRSMLIPVRYQNIPPGYLQHLSRTARSIYALVNGANTIQRIAALLSLPLPVVYAELMALYNDHLIVFAQGPTTR